MIKIEVDDKDVRALLEKVKRRAEDPAPLMRQIAGIMADEVEQNFEKEGRPRWKPLAKSTIRQRKRKGHWPGKMLQVSGKLAASITEKSGSNSAQVAGGKILT
ncbi:MAG: phage virion morphogenesis protein [Nitrospiraceae bacterium]|nr:phage virion morphogenesis protein [Nitrospiraceae bacterium]